MASSKLEDAEKAPEASVEAAEEAALVEAEDADARPDEEALLCVVLENEIEAPMTVSVGSYPAVVLIPGQPTKLPVAQAQMLAALAHVALCEDED